MLNTVLWAEPHHVGPELYYSLIKMALLSTVTTLAFLSF